MSTSPKTPGHNDATVPTQPQGREFLHQRRDFLKMVGGVGGLMAVQGAVNFWPLQAAPEPSGRNVIIFITDQQRALQWFPAGWAAANLPCQTALADTGVTFSRAFTNTAMCTPARTTLFTGLYPAQHLSADTLSEGNVQSEAEHQLNPTYPNLGAVMTAAGYEMAYIGKYHLSKGVVQPNGVDIWDDIERYSFSQWDPPDAGRNTSLGDYGGGNADNDARYIGDAITYLTNKINNPGGKPFCLVVSLVNPHDVLG
jgi:choline-sulfatase